MVVESDSERKKYAAKCFWIGLRSLLPGIGFSLRMSRYVGDAFVIVGAGEGGQLFSDDLRCALCFDGLPGALRATDGHHLTVYRIAVNMHALLPFGCDVPRRKQVKGH
jgi:hypothetical protein